MPSLDILEDIFDKKKLSVLRSFYNEPDKEFHLRELASITKVSVASTFRIMKKLKELGLITEVKAGKFKAYKLGDNENTRFLGQIVRKERQILQIFVTRAKSIEGLEEINLQGREDKDRANVMLIGSNIDNQAVKQLCADIKEQLNFIVSPLIVSREQFEQMSKMYPIERKVLFRDA